MILRLLGWQGIAGAVIALALGALLVFQKGETRHWRKQSAQYEQLYRGEQSAHRQTELNVRRATDAARADDQANAIRVRSEQAAINQETNHDLEVRLADARARAAVLGAGRVRREAGAAAANSGSGRAAPVSGVPAAAGGAGQTAGQNRLPPAAAPDLAAPDALTATEQAIQLDELIKWVRRQVGVDTNAASGPTQAGVDRGAPRP